MAALPARSLRPALAGLCALALIASGCGGSSATATPPTRTTPLISIFEAQSQLFTDPVAAVAQLRQLGVNTIRVFLPWGSVAPDAMGHGKPSGFDGASPNAYPPGVWSVYDAIDRAASARGVRVYLTLEGPAPLWATAPGAPRSPSSLAGYWKPSPSAYGAFVRAAGIRYSGHYTPPGESSPLPRVSFWGLWNEPNDGPQLAPQTIDNGTVELSAGIYRSLVGAGWSALGATGHGSDTILIGELAPFGQSGPGAPGTFGEMVPLRFVRALYCVGSSLQPLRGAAATARGCPTTSAGSKAFAADNPGLFHASGFAVHPYPGPGRPAPNVVPAGSPDFANLAALPTLEHLLDTLTSQYGTSTRFPLYSTEYGYFTDPPFALGAPLAVAAAYLNWAEYISWRNPRIVSFDQYLLSDPPGSGPSKFVTGLEFANGTPKPSYDAWRMPIYLPLVQAGHGKQLQVWGCVRPAHYAQLDTGQAQRVKIELRPTGSSAFSVVRTLTITDPNGYFDTPVAFPSGGAVRLAWSYPHGPTIYSREVQITGS